MVDWTRERIAELSLEGVKNLRQNANRRGETAIIERCDSELAARAPVRYKSPRITGSREFSSRSSRDRLSFCLSARKGCDEKSRWHHLDRHLGR